MINLSEAARKRLKAMERMSPTERAEAMQRHGAHLALEAHERERTAAPDKKAFARAMLKAAGLLPSD